MSVIKQAKRSLMKSCSISSRAHNKDVCKTEDAFFATYNDEDLVAKERQYHLSCYEVFTRQYKKPSSMNDQHNEDKCELLADDFQSIVNCINHEVLELRKAVTITIIHSIYVQGTRYKMKVQDSIQN